MDYRLTHRGLANHSDQVRPILSVVYHRPWFRDAVNHRNQPPFIIGKDDFAAVPKPRQRLFSWLLADALGSKA